MHSAVRKERELARTREDIVEAAARAFARRGYRAATMAEIAREAGYTAPTLYSYFASKEEIFAELRRVIRAEFQTIYETPMPRGLDFRQRLELLVTRKLELIERRRDAFQVMYAIRYGQDAGPRPDPGRQQQIIKRLAGWLADAGAEVVLRPLPLEDLAAGLWGLQHGFVLSWMQGGEGKLVDRAPMIVELFLNGAARSRRRT
jgi:AcrR family transcriptional regulator